jgi:hypothetical protein
VIRSAVTRDRRRFGGALLGFGLAGLIVLAGTAAVIVGTLGPIEAAANDVDRQRVELVELLDSASDALRQAADGAGNAGASLTQSATAARDGAALAARMAEAFDGLTVISDLDVFGTRPFAELGASFAEVATRARSLTDNLASTADALETNEADARRSAGDLRDLADRLGELQATLATDPAEPETAAAFGAIALVRIVLLGLIAWLLVPAIVATALGWRWLRAGSTAE